MQTPLDIFSGFYTSESEPFNSQRCINLVPIQPQAQSLNEKALFGSEGITELNIIFGSISGVHRGSIRAAGLLYVVNGVNLYSISAEGVSVELGMISGSGRVSLATNTTVDTVTKIVIIVPGVKGYVYDSSLETVEQILSGGFQVSDTVSFKDGYFIFTTSDGLRFFNSNLNDPQTYDGLDTGTAEMDPDLIVGQIVNHNELFIMGEETGELFQNVGGVGFPFQRIPGANIQKGLAGKFAIAAFDNTFVFAGAGKGENIAIWKLSGSSSVSKISTSAIDQEIQKYTKEEVSNSFAMSWATKGQFFVSFTFESIAIPSRTFVYNATNQSWYERQSGVSDNRWRVQSIINAYGKLFVGDQTTNKIGFLDNDAFDEYGDVIVREVTSQPFRMMDRTQFVDNLELVMENGVGLTSGQGSEPVIRMSFSDNGKTFSPEFARSFGKIGEYIRRTIWRRQGSPPTRRTVRFRMTDPVRCNILGCTADDEVGS